MPISSSEIAAMNAQFSMAMGAQQQQSQMIGQGMPMSDSLVGGGMNRAAAIGGPMASLGLGLAGLDPISMAFRGGSMGMRMGMGLGGTAAMGLGAAGIATGGAMAVGYAVNQFAAGAQQQQQFGNMMNSTFRFANNYGGQGFSRGGLGEIGGTMRQMSTEQGSMGQMVGFEELGRLASNMGRMGMAQGVRDAKEFSDKFREMVKTVKQIAESMGTSLEEAQKMMGAMRSSGVFGQNQAAQFASRVRLGAQAGGMATSELTGMMQVGSQISRMVGGRGRAGAAGGLETITNIGVAQQMGLISEEDIYNTTGLTGAEGRRAMATRQMETSAQFLQGSLGRRFLASVAGKNGQLDEGSVSRYMSGGVGTEDTISMYNKNLNKVGRANFIRNEGKLRGAALEKFGGLVPMIAMKNWLDERGINPNEDNDRAMIFMQRQLGMGSDESEMMLRQVRELPQLMRQRRTAGEDDDYMRRAKERQSHTGLEGIQHKFDKAKSDVNKVLNQAGASFYESMSEAVDGFINRLTDTYVKETRQDIANAFRTMMSGGAMGAEAASTTFGLGKKFRSAGSSNVFSKGPSDLSIFQEGDASRFAAQGFAMTGSDITGHLSKVSQITGAFRGGTSGLQDRTEVMMAGAGSASAFRQSVLNGEVTGKGTDRLSSFGTFLRGQAGLGGLADQYARAGDVEKAQLMAAFTGKGGADLDQSSYFQDPGLKGVYGVSGARTVGESVEEVGNSFMGLRKGGVGNQKSIFGALTAGRDSKRVGSYLMSEGGRSTIDKMMSDNSDIRRSARDSVEREIISLRDKEDRSSEEDGRLKGLQGLLMSQKLTEMEVNGASQEQLDAEAARLGKENGLSVDEVKSQVSTIGALAERNKQMAMGQAGERFGERARSDIAGLQRSGLVTGSGDNLTLRAAAADKLGGGSAGKAFLTAMVEKQKAMSKMGPGADNQALFAQANAAGQLMNQNLAGMSVAEQRKLAEGLSGVEGAEEAAGDVGMVAGVSGSLERSGKKGGMANAAGMLGANISKEELAKLVSSGGLSGAAKAIAGRIGDGSLGKNSAFLKDLETSLGSIQSGNFGAAGQQLTGLLGNETVSKARVDKSNDSDPNFHLKGIKEDTKNMADSLKGAVTQLEAINKSTTKSAEDWL